MLIATLLLLPHLYAQQDELVRLYAEARSAEAASDYPTASQRYERIVALRPHMAEAYANLGNLYYVQGRLDRAETSFLKAIRLKPGLAAPHLLLGFLYFNNGDPVQAVPQLTSALKLDPSNAMGELYLGFAYYALARYTDSASFLEKAAVRDEKNLDAWYHLSMVYGQLSKLSFEALQKQHADAFETHLARSHFYESTGNWAEARQELMRALTQQPDGAERLKRRVEWLEQRSAGKALDPPSPEPCSEDGSTQYLHNPPAGAAIQDAIAAEKSLVAQALHAAPPTRQSLYRLAEGYQALSFLSSMWVLQADPDSYRAHQLRAQSLEAAGRMDEAVAHTGRPWGENRNCAPFISPLGTFTGETSGWMKRGPNSKPNSNSIPAMLRRTMRSATFCFPGATPRKPKSISRRRSDIRLPCPKHIWLWNGSPARRGIFRKRWRT